MTTYIKSSTKELKYSTKSNKFINYLIICLGLFIFFVYGLYVFCSERQKLFNILTNEAQTVSTNIDKLLNSYQAFLTIIHEEINPNGKVLMDKDISTILKHYSPEQAFNVGNSLINVMSLSWIETNKPQKNIGSLGIISNQISFSSKYLKSIKSHPGTLQLNFENEEYIDFGLTINKEENLCFINLRLAKDYFKKDILKNNEHYKSSKITFQNNAGENLFVLVSVGLQNNKHQYIVKHKIGTRPYYLQVNMNADILYKNIASNLIAPLILIIILGLSIILILHLYRHKIVKEVALEFNEQLLHHQDLSQKNLKELNKKEQKLKDLEEYKGLVKKSDRERIKYQNKIKDYLIKTASENTHMSKLLLTNINGELGFELTYEKQLSLIMKLYDNSYFLASQIVPKAEIKKVNINTFIFECMSIFERRAYEHNIGIHFEPSQTIEAYVDEVQFKQMFMSLLSKAVDRAKSYISIKTEFNKNNNNSHFTIEILDDGFLVSEEAITKFNQFKRSNYDNLALDWKNVEKLVELMEGKLIVESKSDQKNKLVVTFSSDKPKTNKDNQFHEGDDKSNKIVKIY